MKTNQFILIIIHINFLILLIISCDTTKNNNSQQCISNLTAKDTFSFTQLSRSSLESPRTITITKGTFTSFANSTVSADVADKAVRIASRVLSSQDFQSKVITLSFMYENHCKDCGTNANHSNERISGKEVLDSIFKKAAVVLNLKMTVGKCKGVLGSTCPGSDNITSNYQAIHCDMSNLSFEYAYAVHLCHEYMHIIGYCHTDHKDDVAEKIGWIAYYIVLDWQTNHQIP